MRRALPALIGFCLLTATAASGQVTLGLKAGFNISDLNVENASGENVDWKSQAAFAGGAYLQIGLGNVFAIQPEILYSPKGAKQDITDGTLSLDLTYLDVPLLLMVRVPTGDSPVWPILYVGPVISFEMDCKLKSPAVTVDCDAGGTPASRTKATDYGATFGAGFEFFFGSVRSQLDARYTLGLKDINATDSGASVKNRGWTFLFGLGYALSP